MKWFYNLLQKWREICFILFQVTLEVFVLTYSISYLPWAPRYVQICMCVYMYLYMYTYIPSFFLYAKSFDNYCMHMKDINKHAYFVEVFQTTAKIRVLIFY